MMFDPILDWFRGKAVTIPPLDGAFRPNQVLDEAQVVATLPSADNIAVHNGEIIVSSGRSLFSVGHGREPQRVHEYDSEISATAVSPEAGLAVALASGKLILDGKQLPLPGEISCITALAFAPDGSLWIANGAAGIAPTEWVRDLMAKGSSGSIWTIEPGNNKARKLVAGLAFPFGLMPVSGGVAVSEAWNHRILRVSKHGDTATVIDNLPGYPARLSAARDGAWLSIFAPRNRLIEFVLQEKRYREDMIATVPPEFWIAPSLASGESFLEPLQCGGIKTMGIHKPWSPSRSYGLVAKLDAALRPVGSFHSRANGVRHGTTSAIEHEGRLLVASKGGGVLVSVDATEIG